MIELSTLLKYFLVFSIPCLVTGVLTPIVAKYAFKYDIFLDKPSARRIHSKITPRCGGIALFIGVISVAITTTLVPHVDSYTVGVFNGNWWLRFLVPAALIFLLGAYDDFKGVPALKKLTAQIAVGIIAYYMGFAVSNALGATFSPVISLGLTVAWYVLIINAFNIIDGMDGLCTGLAIVALSGLAILHFHLRAANETLVILGLLSACLGFLIHNFHPAKIFLGDCGSHLLGFTVATVALTTNSKSTTVATLGITLLAMGIPVFDVVLAIWRRTIRGIMMRLDHQDSSVKVTAADLDHLHHRLLNEGYGPARAAVWLYIANFGLVVLGFASFVYSNQSAGFSLLGILLLLFVVTRCVAQVELTESGELILVGMKSPRGPLLTHVVYPLMDLAILSIGLWISLFLTVRSSTSLLELKDIWFSRYTLWVFIPFFGLFLSGTYQKLWRRAAILDYLHLGATLATSSFIAMSIECILDDAVDRQHFTEWLCFLALVAIPVLGLRTLPWWIRETLALVHDSVQGNKSRKKTLLYGTGRLAHIYLQNRQMDEDRRLAEDLIGYIEDDVSLRHQRISGFPVLGVRSELPQILRDYDIDHIVLTKSLNTAQMVSLKTLLFDMNRSLSVLKLAEEEILRAEQV